MGTCVGGAFALMTAANARICDRVAFVVTYAPYSSMWTLTRDIATATRASNTGREPWTVDPLTRAVYVRSLTALLEPGEAELLRRVAQGEGERADLDPERLSPMGRAVYPLLERLSLDEAEAALRHLPPALSDRLEALSPLHYVSAIHAPRIVVLHDRDDAVIPVGESRRLRDALAGRAGVSYTEFALFQHMDPTTASLSPVGLLRQLGLFFRAGYPVFRLAVRTPGGRGRRVRDRDRRTSPGPLPGIGHRGAGPDGRGRGGEGERRMQPRRLTCSPANATPRA